MIERQEPRTAAEVRTDVLRDVQIFSSMQPLSKGRKGALVGHLNKALGSDDNRHLFLGYLFGRDGLLTPVSTKDLSESEWWAIEKFVGSFEVDGHWKTQQHFHAECFSVLTESIRAFNGLTAFPPVGFEISAVSLVAQAVSQLGGKVTMLLDESGNPTTPRVAPRRTYSTLEEFLGDDVIE